MITLDAWYLPPGFTLREGEVATLGETEAGGGGGAGTAVGTGDGAPVIRYAPLSQPRMAELTELLRGERERNLVEIQVDRIVESVDRVAWRFMTAGDPLRDWVLDGLAGLAGFSDAMAEAVMEGMARGWTAESLRTLLLSEFVDPNALDGFVSLGNGSRGRALGPPLAFHLGAGTVPGVATTSLVRTLLVKSAILMRPGRGDLILPLAFCRGLAEEAPDLAGAMAVLYWPVEESGRTESVLAGVDLVVAYGGDRTVDWIRKRVRPSTPFRSYRHRMGFGLVGRGALQDVRRAGEVARDAAEAVALFDQRGCVSPHVLFVEEGGEVDPREWARLLAMELGHLEATLPSGRVPPGTGVAIQQLRGASEMAESLGDGMVLHGGEDAPWTVTFVPHGSPEPSCLNRVVTVLPVKTADEALAALRDWMPYLQTVGLEGFGETTREIQESLARLGVSRIVSFSSVPWPEPWWHHDGSGPLQDLVRWTDVEGVGL